ncbi:MAG TPA: HAD-IIIC family phosphatase [Vicinamibacterales bacterium]|nr:HAD-IIIC family phosphatase [Vicinamibacterales bacterium]
MSELLQRIRTELPGYTFNDYVRHLHAVDEAVRDAPTLRVAVLRSYTLEPLEPVLRVLLALEGFRASVWFGGYNQYVQEILDSTGPLSQQRPDLVLLLLRLEDALPEFVDDFSGRSAAEWETRITAKVDEVAGLAAHVRDATSAQVIVQNMTAPPQPWFGAFDPQRPHGQTYLAQRFNQQLASALEATRGTCIWDFDGLVRAKGADNLFDPKTWYVSRNPFRQAAYPAIGADLVRYIRASLGRVKKCIVLDLDNTLWGGVAGEDGLEGIRLGRSYPGNCYRDFQKELLKLRDRGILLAINSKNNEEDALRILDEHPDMILRRRHFAAVRINWEDKAANLHEIASELNIGLDSLIFVDDSPTECERIRQECPACEVVLAPDKPYRLPALAAALPGVDTIALTDEDRRKSAMYAARAARREQAAQYANLGEFLRNLDIEVTIDPATPFSIPRIAQLTQKTNQMNMTTRRYTEAQIRSMAADPAHAVFAVSARDRFGDEGIIGVIILASDAEICAIDTFLLSCRVIGRGIEEFMIAFVADSARANGATTLTAEFLPTAKNKPARGFYERAGFRKRDDSRFEANLRDVSFRYPDHIKGIATARAMSV